MKLVILADKFIGRIINKFSKIQTDNFQKNQLTTDLLMELKIKEIISDRFYHHMIKA